MDKSSDIYAISGRIKNLIAKNDLMLSATGMILVNAYTLVLKDLHDFAELLPIPYNNQLKDLLISREGFPEYVIRVSSPKEDRLTLYEEVMEVKAEFDSNEDALEYFTRRYEDLGLKYNMTGDDFWIRAENSDMLNEDTIAIMKLNRSISICKYLIQKDKDNDWK